MREDQRSDFIIFSFVIARLLWPLAPWELIIFPALLFRRGIFLFALFHPLSKIYAPGTRTLSTTLGIRKVVVMDSLRSNRKVRRLFFPFGRQSFSATVPFDFHFNLLFLRFLGRWVSISISCLVHRFPGSLEVGRDMRKLKIKATDKGSGGESPWKIKCMKNSSSLRISPVIFHFPMVSQQHKGKIIWKINLWKITEAITRETRRFRRISKIKSRWQLLSILFSSFFFRLFRSLFYFIFYFFISVFCSFQIIFRILCF